MRARFLKPSVGIRDQVDISVEHTGSVLFGDCGAQRLLIGYIEEAADARDGCAVPAIQRFHSVLDAGKDDRRKVIVPLDRRYSEFVRTRPCSAHRGPQQNRKLLFRSVGGLAIGEWLGPTANIEAGIIEIDQQITRLDTQQTRYTLHLIDAGDHFAPFDFRQSDIRHIRQGSGECEKLGKSATCAQFANAIGKNYVAIGVDEHRLGDGGCRHHGHTHPCRRAVRCG